MTEKPVDTIAIKATPDPSNLGNGAIISEQQAHRVIAKLLQSVKLYKHSTQDAFNINIDKDFISKAVEDLAVPDPATNQQFLAEWKVGNRTAVAIPIDAKTLDQMADLFLAAAKDREISKEPLDKSLDNVADGLDNIAHGNFKLPAPPQARSK